MSASITSDTPNMFADSFSEHDGQEVVKETIKFIEILRQAALAHDFSDSVCCHRLRIWEETINSPASE